MLLEVCVRGTRANEWLLTLIDLTSESSSDRRLSFVKHTMEAVCANEGRTYSERTEQTLECNQRSL